MARRRIVGRSRELQPDGERLKEWLGDHYIDIESGEGVNDSRWEIKSHLASLVCRDRRGLVINYPGPGNGVILSIDGKIMSK